MLNFVIQSKIFLKKPSNYYLIVYDGCISSLFLKLILNRLFVHLNSQFLYCGHSYFFREKSHSFFLIILIFFYMFKIGLELITIKYIHMTRVEWLYQIIVKKINILPICCKITRLQYFWSSFLWEKFKILKVHNLRIVIEKIKSSYRVQKFRYFSIHNQRT